MALATLPLVLGVLTAKLGAQVATDSVRVVERGFIYDSAPFPSAHASTIVEVPGGAFLAAWFGGAREGADDVEIWLSRKDGAGPWSEPRELTSYPADPTWNPVLFQMAGQTWLFFKVGPSPREWVGAYRTSTDGGHSWSDVTYLPAGQLGPVRAKPILLSNGDVLAGTSVEAGYGPDTPSDAPYRSWSVWVERSPDGGRTWFKHGPIAVPGEPYGVIQPTLWQTASGEVRMFMRSTSRIGRICEAVSEDGGKTWSAAWPTDLPNPNAGIDVARLSTGRLVLVYNHREQGRGSIHLAFSDDDGTTWSAPYLLEGGPDESGSGYSYPAVIQGSDGLLHITYTWHRRRIRYVVVDPATF